LEEAGALLAGGGVALRLPELGQQAGEAAGVAARHEPGDAFRADVADERAQHGRERRERQAVGAELQAAADEDAGAFADALRELADQAGLAEPRVAAEEHGAGRGGERVLQLVQFGGSADQDGTHRAWAHVTSMPKRRGDTT